MREKEEIELKVYSCQTFHLTNLVFVKYSKTCFSKQTQNKYMLSIAIIGLISSIFVALILFIALCSKTDEPKPEKKSSSSEGKDSLFEDSLAEFSENVAFHVIQNSNKKERAKKAEEASSDA